MAVTANQMIVRRGNKRKMAYPIASGIRIYEGTMCFLTTAGYLTNVIATGANRFVGIADKEYDNSGGGNGALWAEVYEDGSFLLTGSGFAQTQVGEAIYASDNFTITTTSADMSYVGTCKRFESATQLEVDINTNVSP